MISARISSGPMDFCMFSLFKCSLAWSSSTTSKPSSLQPLVSGAWDSWRQVLPVKMEVKGTEHIDFSMSFVTKSPAPFSGSLTNINISSVPTAADMPTETILFALHAPVRFHSILALAFLTPSPWNWVVPFRILLAALTLLLPVVLREDAFGLGFFGWWGYVFWFVGLFFLKNIGVFSGAPYASMQASWRFCLTYCLREWTVLKHWGGDLWTSAGFPGALFSSESNHMLF